MPTQTVSLAEAKRIALAALGFNRKRPARPSSKDMARVINQLALIQIDSVNVLVQAHYMVLFSRLGPYERATLDKLIYRSGQFTEQWAHEASIIPVDTWPLLKHRMDTHRVRPWPFEEFMSKFPAYVADVLEEVRKRGPLRGEHVPPPEGAPTRILGSWNASVGRAVLEAHFGYGRLAISNRLTNFAREYDLAERVIPAVHLTRTIDTADAQRELIRKAAVAYGIATAADLADYFRMRPADAKARIAELVELRELETVRVDGWRDSAYLRKSAKLPQKPIAAGALLSPFDPLVWFRPRAERLFNFHYRIEIYTPEPQRKWGYYVLPFLSGEKLVARVDLKADRKASKLRVLAAHIEPGVESSEHAQPLMNELQQLAKWLSLTKVEVERRGKFAPHLRRL